MHRIGTLSRPVEVITPGDRIAGCPGDQRTRAITAPARKQQPPRLPRPVDDGGTLLMACSVHRATVGYPAKALHRGPDVFAEAAALDRERVRRRGQLHAVQAALHGRRHGLRRARQGARLDRLIARADHLAEPLTQARSR
ncbi:hypothetical protein [Streptomyces sp. RB17]|uniref:hypothetical protein n=1 Tax=Streptomyces sp. RB17 TaxID=2585197 RepID=UPI003A4C7902